LHYITKNVPRFTCYNLDRHDPIGIIFGRSEKQEIRRCSVFPHLQSYLVLQHYLAKGETQRQRTGALWLQNSPIAAAFSTSFLLNHIPDSPKLNALVTWFRESYSNVCVVSQKVWRNQAAAGWILAMH